MQKTILTFGLILLTYFISAQGGRGSYGGEKPKGNISGTILDASTAKPVLYATVALYKLKDSTLLTGTMSSDEGKFTISDVPAGRYYLVIKFIGYDKYTSKPITLRPPNLDLKLEKIKLKQASTSLAGVEIVAEKNFCGI
jgi:5-hydroxyisourate hydrolase-like protein (transthyretin family)